MCWVGNIVTSDKCHCPWAVYSVSKPDWASAGPEAGVACFYINLFSFISSMQISFSHLPQQRKLEKTVVDEAKKCLQ